MCKQSESLKSAKENFKLKWGTIQILLRLEMLNQMVSDQMLV